MFVSCGTVNYAAETMNVERLGYPRQTSLAGNIKASHSGTTCKAATFTISTKRGRGEEGVGGGLTFLSIVSWAPHFGHDENLLPLATISQKKNGSLDDVKVIFWHNSNRGLF